MKRISFSRDRRASLRVILFASVVLVFVFPGSPVSAEGSGPQAEVDQAAFRRGRALSVTECMGCHRVYRPAEYAPEAWPGIVKKMGARASLNEGQMRDLEIYFVSAASGVQPSRK